MRVPQRLRPAALRLRGTWRTLRARALLGSRSRLALQLQNLSGSGRHAAAVELIVAELPAHRRDKWFLREATISATSAGALSLQVDLLDAAEEVGVRGASRRLRLVEGVMRETTEGWRPPVTLIEAAEPPEPTRILHLLKTSLPYRQSGYTVRSTYTLKALRRAGYDPIAMTPLDFPHSIGTQGVAVEEIVDGIRYIRLDRPTVPPGQPVDAYLEDWSNAAAPWMRSLRPAVVHVHSGHRGYETALVGLALAERAGLPLVYEVRGFFESLWTRDLDWAERAELTWRRRDTDTRCMAAAGAVVTLSDTMRNVIVARGVPADRVHVIPNGVDVDTFQPRDRNPALAARHGLTDRFVFGYVSNLDHFREGHELLIEAAIRLRAQGIPATALIVGDGHRRAELERLAARLGADDAVVFTGRVPHADVLDYYALLDVFVIPRVDELAARLVTPLKPYEAMAAGRPLLVSDLDALKEVVGDDRGRVFPAGDVPTLVDVLSDMHAHPDQLVRMAERARSWVVAERQWSHNASRYQRVYEQVLRGVG